MRIWFLYAQGDVFNEGWPSRPALAGPQAGYSRTAQTLGRKPLCLNPAICPAISARARFFRPALAGVEAGFSRCGRL
jgi:hypothetical protein